MTRPSLLAPILGMVLISGATAAGAADDGWVALFDGKTLDGWKVQGGTASYRVEDGAVVGTTVEGSPNTFLCKGDYRDFELELEVRCDPRLNSGVQVRSHVYAKDDPDPNNAKRAGVVYGPQCEVARKETGTAGRFYDEGRRGKWLDEIKPEAKDAFNDDGWNRYRIVVRGQRYRSWVNGVAASDFTDDADKSGFIGLQVHGIARGSGPYQVRWRNVRIKELKGGEGVSAADPPKGKAGERFEALLAVALKDPAKADWKALRLAFAETDAFAPYSTRWREDDRTILKKIKDGDAAGAEPLLKTSLERDRYMRLETHLTAAMLYSATGQNEKQVWHRGCIEGIVGTLFVPGTGMSFENPINVLFIEEEYFFVSALKLKAKRQGLADRDGHKFDVYKVEAEGERPEGTLYFCVDLAQKSLHRLLKPAFDAEEEKAAARNRQ